LGNPSYTDKDRPLVVNVFDPLTLSLIGAVLMVLGCSWAVVKVLKRRPESGIDPAILETFHHRVRAWWILFAVLAAAFLFGHIPTVILFGLISFWALREFITLTPTRPGDHRTLFWVFFLITPLQFVLVVLIGMGYRCYEFYSIMIPVYAFLFVPAYIAMAGDYKRFLERSAKIQAGLLICVYCLSYAPGLLALPQMQLASVVEKQNRAKALPRTVAGESAEPAEGRIADADRLAVQTSVDSGGGARLLFFFVLIVQLSDALQYAWSQIRSKHVIVPTINATKTW
jgi:phosphatidate cytidylyltransferase